MTTQFIANPVVLMLQNKATQRFHPILFWESPMPSQTLGSALRWKSKGHHTTGFNQRSDAVNAMMLLVEQSHGMNKVGSVYYLDDQKQDGHWSGDDTPTSVMFFNLADLTKYEPCTKSD